MTNPHDAQRSTNNEKMNCLVTGAAGFIGSHLCEALLAQGHRVVGLDAFTDNYAASIKRGNLVALNTHASFRLVEDNLLSPDWPPQIGEVDWVFHLAARPGVRTSWGADFSTYCEQNLLATQRLLEVCLGLRPQKIVFSSSSSVYGNARRLPVRETSPLHPISPYGATKLAAEHICQVYRMNYRLPICLLRYFTVYGPRQRPDMAFSRWIAALEEGQPIRLFGDGRQSRDFTFVADAVRANILAAEKAKPGEVFNVAGGSQVTMREVVELMGELAGKSPQVQFESAQKGDARRTWADTSRARERLGFTPKVALRQGLSEQIAAGRGGGTGKPGEGAG